MRQEITIRIKDQYGKNVAVPVCKEAITFAQIAGTKTLTPRVLSAINSLGYVINIKGCTQEEVEKQASKNWQYLDSLV